MNCHTVLELLECVPPISGDISDPDFELAVAHLQKCEKCDKVFNQRQQLDRRVANAMLDVPIPVNLKERLLLSLENDSVVAHVESIDSCSSVVVNSEEETTEVGNVTVKRSSRRWLAVSTATALMVCLAFGVWQFWTPDSPQLTAQDLRAVPILKSKGWANSVGKPLPLPAGWSQRLTPFGSQKSVPIGSLKGVAAVVQPFTFRGQGSPTVFLLIVPAGHVKDSSIKKMFSAAVTRYVGIGPQRLALATWSSRGYVYVCFVRGKHNTDDLQYLKQSSAGLTT
jgi:hypothetical protein